jgi:carnitine 3-dehydrogenase
MNLPEPSSVHRVGVIGAGTIGASWAAYFLARGMEVQAWDPAPDAEAALRAFVAEAWPTLDGLDVVADGASPDRLTFHAGPAAAVDGVEFVQESAPEKLDVKRTLYAEIDTVLPGDVVMASSTSGLIMSKLQSGFTNAARFVVGHPFNPPHLIPLVEVVGGADTAASVVDWSIDFYNAHGKKAIRLNHEAPGHLVNRLQVALWREAMDAVLTGLASVEDVDAAIKYGPGLRLSVMGPFELCHLAGGPKGYSNFLDHFGDALQHWMDNMRTVELTPEVRAKLKTLVAEAIGEREFASIAGERDTLLLPVLSTLARARREHSLY